MATIGLSKPYYAIYTYDATLDEISYSDGGLLAKAVEFSAEIETAEGNVLYGDNGPVEIDNSFSSGTLTITTDDLEQAASAAILGITPTAIEGQAGITELIYNDDMVVPDLGFGCVIKKQKGGTVKWRAIVFPKIKFSIPSEAATTQGESIEWQTPELSATIMRDDSTKHAWKREATFTTEAAAVSYIKNLLDIAGA